MNKKPLINDKRNYIRRKKYLQDCANHIKAAIDFMSIVKGCPINNEDSEKQATFYAQQIEAVCWSPRSQMSAESYQKLMQTKTREFTCTILKKTLPFLDICQLQKIASTLILEHFKYNNSTSPSINFDLLKSINMNSLLIPTPYNLNSSKLDENIHPINNDFKSNPLMNPPQANLKQSNALFVEQKNVKKSTDQNNMGKYNSTKNNYQQHEKLEKKYSKLQQKKCKKEDIDTRKFENSMEVNFPISPSDIMSTFEFGDGSPNNPYFIPNVELEDNLEEKNELYPILFKSDELAINSSFFPATLSLNIDE